MDDPGYHARKRAAAQAAYYAHPELHPHASAQKEGVATVEPLNEPANPSLFLPTADEIRHGSDGLPDQEARDKVAIPEAVAEGYEIPNYRPPIWVAPETMPGTTNANATAQSVTSHAGPSAAVVESHLASRPAGLTSRHHSVLQKMDPHLQFMSGPHLVYHTCKDGVWHGAAMIVLADAGSIYEPRPSLGLDWRGGDVDAVVEGMKGLGTQEQQNGAGQKKTEGRTSIEGETIHIYHGPQGTFSFIRFKLEVPMGEKTKPVHYSINKGTSLTFHVPGLNENLRWAAHSCNGFSGGVDTEAFYDHDKFDNGYDPLWTDMLAKHEESPFHCMIGGGDQIYADSLTLEPELQHWVNAPTAEEKEGTPLSDDIQFAVDRYYFSRYCTIFRTGAFGVANASIPMVNCLDDHDLIDGFGSYPDELQRSAVFKHIGSRGYFWYCLFQLFVVDAVDGTEYGKEHYNKSVIIGGDGPWIPAPNHSFLTYLGPDVAMLLLDCRAERKKDQVCSKLTYERVFAEIAKLPDRVQQLVVQIGIPIAYPRMNFAEKALESKYNPGHALEKIGLVPGFVNKFNKEAELLDDLNDHWTSSSHKPERNWFVEECQRLAVQHRVRISFLSGDVHCAATAAFFSMPESKLIGHKDRLKKEVDPKYMLQVVTSAIVNTPPPSLVSTVVSKLGEKRHKTLHYAKTDEEMINLFTEDTDGTSLKHQSVMGRRNWTMVDFLPETSELRYDIRVEIVQGGGDTKGYAVSSPPPQW